MSSAAKILWAVCIALFAGAAVGSNFIPANDTGFEVRSHTSNAGELTVDTLVGQTFTAERDNLSAVRVMFATYSNRNNTEPVLFYLRSSIHSSENIRTAEVLPSQLGDNQFHTFSFDPIPDSKDQQYFFFIVSPTSSEGNAVTIDLNTQDPYHLGTAYAVRGQGPQVTTPAILELSGKPTQDVVFGLQYSGSLREVVVGNLVSGTRIFIRGWTTNHDVYLAYIWGAVAALIFFVAVVVFQNKTYLKLSSRLSKKTITVISLLLLFAAAIIFRLKYASELPLTNDEGNYLYDAVSLRRGILAGGDGYVKTPLVILWVALWQMILGNTALAGRMASVIIGALTVFPLYSIARNLWTSESVTRYWTDGHGWGRRIAIGTAAAWAVFGVAVVFSIYVHTQPLALFFGVSGLALLLSALRGTTPRRSYLAKKVPSSSGWFFLAGMLIGLGVASRKSILALGLVPILFILAEGKSWKLRIAHFLSVAFGFLLVIGLFLGSAYYLYGTQGIYEAIGINSAEDGLGAVTQDEVDQVRAYSLRGMTPFFRESLPVILLSVLGLGFSLEYLVSAILERMKKIPYAQVVARLAWIFPWAVFWWAATFFFEYEGESFMRYGIPVLWWLFGGILAIATVWPASPRKHKAQETAETKIFVPVTSQPGFHGQARKDTSEYSDSTEQIMQLVTAALAIPLWIGGLVFFYTNWIKFHANYISEFIPPLILLAGFGAFALLHRLSFRPYWVEKRPWTNILRLGLVSVFIAVTGYAIVTSNYITYFFEHTGTFHQGAAAQAAQWVKDHIPQEDSIFTGAALIPYLSGNHTALDIAHPRWYAYEFTRKDTGRLNTFLPPAEEMVEAYRNANWFLLESQTGFSFLMEYSEIEAGLTTDWEQVYEIENGGNPITIYRRVK